MTLKNPLHQVMGSWRARGSGLYEPADVVPVVPEWWTIGGVYDNTQVVYAASFKKGANLAQAIVNETGGVGALADPGGGATPNWAAGVGITGDGLVLYLSSNIIPAAGWSVFVQYSGGGGSNNVLIGSDDLATARCTLWPELVGNCYYYNGSGATAGAILAAGNMGVAGQQGYRNGGADGGAIPGWAGGGVLPFYVLCANWGGVPSQYSAATITALWIANVTITAPQAATLAAAMAAL